MRWVGVLIICAGCSGVEPSPVDSGAQEPRDGSVSVDGGVTDAGVVRSEDGGVCAAGPENTTAACSDGCSNDGDRFADCNDYDCCGARSCPANTACGARKPTGFEATKAACMNGLDDDGDGHKDGEDFGCCQLTSPSACPTTCDVQPFALTVSGATATGTTMATFVDAKPGMWQANPATEQLVYSEENYRRHSREFGLRFTLPPLPGSGFVAAVEVSITASAKATWNAFLLDPAFGGSVCKVGASAFGLSIATSDHPTFRFTQLGFPYPDLWQSGSTVTLLIAQAGEDVSALPDTAELEIRYKH